MLTVLWRRKTRAVWGNGAESMRTVWSNGECSAIKRKKETPWSHRRGASDSGHRCRGKVASTQGHPKQKPSRAVRGIMRKKRVWESFHIFWWKHKDFGAQVYKKGWGKRAWKGKEARPICHRPSMSQKELGLYSFFQKLCVDLTVHHTPCWVLESSQQQTRETDILFYKAEWELTRRLAAGQWALRWGLEERSVSRAEMLRSQHTTTKCQFQDLNAGT